MKSSNLVQVAICLQVLLLIIAPCRAAPGESCAVSVAALSLPANFTGEVHWRGAADSETSPLQLSTRYFSERLKVPGNVIRFYENPVAAGQTEPLPEPLLSVRVPTAAKLAYVVLRSEPGKDGPSRLKAAVLRGDEWKAGCLRVYNACPEAIGIIAGKKRISLPQGKSQDFHANDWKESFPVKVYRSKPQSKLVFSSTWRVTAGRRELCFIGQVGKAVKIRSLIEFKKPPEE